jgi:hypothetical protein
MWTHSNTEPCHTAGEASGWSEVDSFIELSFYSYHWLSLLMIVVMLYLGLKNIRKSSMFPRDPSRLAPWSNEYESNFTYSYSW